MTAGWWPSPVARCRGHGLPKRQEALPSPLFFSETETAYPLCVYMAQLLLLLGMHHKKPRKIAKSPTRGWRSGKGVNRS